MFCVFVDKLPLLSVHAVERLDPAFLLRLLCQLDELGKIVVDRGTELGLLLRELLHEVGVARGYLGAKLRVPDLQG